MIIVDFENKSIIGVCKKKGLKRQFEMLQEEMRGGEVGN